MEETDAILLLEDDDVDVMTIKRVFKDINLRYKLIVAGNGEEGLAYLDQADELPNLILLDLNMPRMGGIEFLEIIKQDERYKHISVVVLTTSDTPADIRVSYERCAAGYFVKPVDYKQFIEAIRTIEMYWKMCKTPET